MFFAILRTYVGGYHAKTHLRCILTFQAIYLGNLWILSVLPTNEYLLAVTINLLLSITIVFVLGPVEHENKPLTQEEYNDFGKKGYYIVLAQAALLVLGLFLIPTFITVTLAASLGMSTASFSACYAKILKLSEGRVNLC